MCSATTMDYNKLVTDHISVAKDLCSEHSLAWPKLFKILTENDEGEGYLSSKYGRRLQNISTDVEDFCYFLYSYLKKNNHYVLTILIETRQSFFSDYFRKVLEDAYVKFEKKYTNRLDMVSIDGEAAEFFQKKLVAPKEKKLPQKDVVKFTDTGVRLAERFRGVWKQNQVDFLSVWFGLALKYEYRYIAELLGMGTGNTVAKRIERFKVAYRADGKTAGRQLNDWLMHSAVLSFIPDTRDWVLNLYMPFDCRDAESCFIRLELVQADRTRVSSATVKYGEKSFPIRDGWGELNLLEFHKLIRKKTGEVFVIDAAGNLSEGFPTCHDGDFTHVITDDLFEKWCVSQETDLAQFLSDFGTGFAWLLNDGLDYSRYGAPKNIGYADLTVASGEAMILFAADCVQLAGPLPKHGFVFPLEWRYLPEYDNPYSALLPESLIELGQKIVKQQNVSRGWGLHPAFRFFHDRVDFSKQTVFGLTEDAVASAYLSLSAALLLAARKYCAPKQIFASAQYDWQRDALQEISQLENKVLLAANWKATEVFVATAQQHEAEQYIRAHALSLDAIGCDSVHRAAFHFLEPLHPANMAPLKVVADSEYKLHRPKLLEHLSALTNAAWDKKGEYELHRNSFIVLSGNPGMGKSILMSDLQSRLQARHTVFSFSCNIGDKRCVENFIKSISYQIASVSSAFAFAALNNLKALAPDAGYEEQYRKLVFEPLTAVADKNKSHRYYLLIDGLDEDLSGEVGRLLADKTMQLPKNYAVVVSMRPIEPLFAIMKANATGVVDLSEKELATCCIKDLKTFIIGYAYGNDAVKSCWYDAGYDDDELREKISSKDKSFLYAKYVLQGVADGMYHFDSLDQELPAGLVAFYEQSFRYRFATEADYAVVRPLLKVLLENESVEISDVASRFQLPIGKLIKLLHGYCTVTGNTLSLCDISLRDWLRDSVKNPDFAIL